MPIDFPAGHERYLGYLQFRVRFVELHPGEPPAPDSSIQTLEAERIRRYPDRLSQATKVVAFRNRKI